MNKNKCLIGVTLCLILLLIVSAACIASTYYVSTTGVDSPTGGTTPETAWASIDYGDAQELLQPGDTVIVLPGIYTPPTSHTGIVAGGIDWCSCALFKNCSGTTANPITYRANGAVSFSARGQTWGWPGQCIFMIQSSNLVIEGFKFTDASYAISLAGNNNEIAYCTVGPTRTTDPQHSPGIYGALYAVNGTTGINVHHNVMGGFQVIQVDHNCSGSFCNNVVVGPYGLDIMSSSLSFTAKNNIFVEGGPWGGAAALRFAMGGGSVSVAHTNNTFYNCGYITNYNGTQTTTPDGTAENTLNPSFVNEASADYRLQSGSPMIDTGANVGYLYSGSAPDRGAFEAGLPVAVSGTVIGNDAPLSGVTVGLWANDTLQTSTTTDENGHYSINMSPGTNEVRINASGFRPFKTFVYVPGTYPQTADFVLVTTSPTTFYVSPTGSDSNSGLSSTSAWASIDKGDKDSVLIPGDTVSILPGTYCPSTSYSVVTGDMPAWTCRAVLKNCSGTAANPITYTASGDVSFSVPGQVWNSSCILMVQSNNLLIKGLKFTDACYAIVLAGNGNEIANCTMGPIHTGDPANSPGVYGALYAVSGTTDMKVHHNVMGGFQVIQVDPNGSGSFCNNVIDGPYGLDIKSSASAYTAKNNIFLNGGPWGGAAALRFAMGGGSVSVAHTNNTFWGCGNIQIVNGTTTYTTPQGFAEDTVNPLLVDSANGDYQLQSGSPMIDAGVYVGYSFNGSNPDRGAYESAGTPSQPGGPISGTVTAYGSALAGALVEVVEGGSTAASVHTDSDGHYSILWKAGATTVRASASGYRTASQAVTVISGTGATASFDLVAATPATFYVSPSGNDANSGTSQSQAWVTVDKGDRDGILIPGDQVVVLDGTYNLSSGTQGVKLGKCMGTADFPITYVSETKGGAVLNRGTATGPALLVTSEITADAYLVFDGLHVKGGTNVLNLANVRQVQVKNCTISDGGGDGAALWMHKCGDCTIHHNLIGTGLPSNTIGILEDASLGSDKIYNNVIVGTTNQAISIGRGLLGRSPKTVDIKNNIISGAAGGIQVVSGALAVTHSNNILYGVTGQLYTGTTAGAGEITSNPDLNSVYVPNSGSPAIDSGLYVGYDFNGTAPDMGWAETSGTIGQAGNISGYVSDSGERVLAGALVQIKKNGCVLIQTVTNDEGYFSIDWSSGAFTVVAKNSGYAQGNRDIVLNPGESIDASVTLDPYSRSTAQTFYVSDAGSDLNDGTSPTSAWASIDTGDYWGQLIPGDTVSILPGTYSPSTSYSATAGGLNWNCCAVLKNCSGTTGNPITYSASGDASFSVPGQIWNSSCILMLQSSNLLIEGIKFTDACYATVLAGSGCEITNCTMGPTHTNDPANSSGVYGALYAVSGTTGINVHNNVMAGFQVIQVDPNGSGSFCNNIIDGPYGLDTKSSSLSFTAKNNIFIGGGPWAGAAALRFGMGGGSVTVDHTNNTFYNCGYITNNNGVQTTTTDGAAENTLNPLFIDELNADYHLAYGSPMIDTGANVSLFYMGTAPDRGPYETQPLPTNSGTVTGKVTDFATTAPIQGAEVVLLANDVMYAITYTDSNGNYSIPAAPGSYTITASSVDYENSTPQSVTVPASNSIGINIALELLDKISDLVNVADGQPVSLVTTIVTAGPGTFTDNLMCVEDKSRVSGVFVVWSPYLNNTIEGDTVSISGTMTTRNGVRMVVADKLIVRANGSELGPLGMPGKSVNGIGLSNAGVLVKTWGKVHRISGATDYFCLDDGSGRNDGLGNSGVPIVVSNTAGGVGTLPTDGAFVTVIGIVSVDDLGGGEVSVVLPRGASDIQ